ncbi:MAG: hypothetical protein NWF04_01475 [Candidatus Bathyarchaeota archaeon]|nr:hypothetical protein [Candidatus Bathyarchaeota archaeon]
MRPPRQKTPLTANMQLETVAYLHSKDMGDNDYFSHPRWEGYLGKLLVYRIFDTVVFGLSSH